MGNGMKIKTKISRVTERDIFLRGHDLTELVGNLSFTDAFFLHMRGRVPDERESKMLSALMVNSMDHGINHPMIVARMTYSVAPEAIQAAFAAGILGLGTVADGSIELVADLLYRTAGDIDNNGMTAEQAAAKAVEGYLSQKRPIPGLGHPKHKSGDPRTRRLFELAKQLGFDGRYVSLLKLIAENAVKKLGKDLPINGAAAVAAMYCELGFPAPIAKAITTVALCAGIAGHLMEELKSPTARTMRSILAEATEFDETSDQPAT